jgi:hypothetical protein
MRYTVTAIKVLALALSLQLIAGCATTGDDPFGILKLQRPRADGLPQLDEEQDTGGQGVYDKVNMMQRNAKTGLWEDVVVKVMQFDGYKAAMCFKLKPGKRVNCFYIRDQTKDVMFMDTIIQGGYRET